MLTTKLRFQSTHPRGVRRLQPRQYQGAAAGFNPRTRVGCDIPTFVELAERRMFQSTHPRGVRHEPLQDGPDHKHRFNPRTRVGCDAPPLVRTSVPSCFNPRTRVGCDAKAPASSTPRSRFQSTHPRGVRPEPGDHAQQNGDVSIHAPAWGATITASTGGAMGSCFNPRTRVGCDTRPCWVAAMPCTFQSTHPRGVRPAASQQARSTIQFQSTHPRGVRHSSPFVSIPKNFSVSIHAPAWGATNAHAYMCEHVRVSIHAPAWGATRRKVQ